ncbi:MAG TPA: DUF2513 domain-containing protein [Rhizomicrobium sp.]|jgi:hypothetical protein|nr:DUF2513 domain-containing protein [Rhizomicrobium sp.]
MRVARVATIYEMGYLDDVISNEVAMQRDMDLIREILLKLEGIQLPPGAMLIASVDEEELQIPGRTPAEVAYHLGLIREHGFINAPGSQPMDGITFRGLTWQGHDFLDSVRDPAIWRDTKEGARKAGGFSVDVLVALAKGLIKKKIEDHTGVKLEF